MQYIPAFLNDTKLIETNKYTRPPGITMYWSFHINERLANLNYTMYQEIAKISYTNAWYFHCLNIVMLF